MNYAYVTINVLDMWAEPSFDSERVNQVLFGEILKFQGDATGTFLSAIEADGYQGWVDKRLVKEIDDNTAIGYPKRSTCRVNTATAEIADGAAPFFLYYGTKLVCIRDEADNKLCQLPDGNEIKLKANQVTRLGGTKDERVDGLNVVGEARKFLGVPYLWGGITSAGVDCSGLVQIVFARFGTRLPRDTKDQVNCGHPVDRTETEPGDLLFFDRHVAIDMGDNMIIHASRAEGGVRISSLAEKDENYRRDLDNKFAAARRVIC